MTSTSTQPEAPSSDGRHQVAVCICTFRRPAELGKLLTRLVEVAADAAGSAQVGVVVVDDDPDGSAGPVVDGFADAFDLGLHAVRSGTGNISVARNHAVETGLGVGTWLAFIDDDCLPDVGWIRELLATADRHGATAVSGGCLDVPPAGAPAWLVDEPFLDDRTHGADGDPVDIGALKNVLVSAAFLRDHDIRFRLDHGRIGGEDVMFFVDMGRAGVHNVRAPAAVVREEVPPARATLRYQLGRRFWIGNTEAVTTLAGGRSNRPRTAAVGVRFALVGAVRPFARLARRQSPQWRYALGEVLRGVGRILGVAGVKVRHR